MPKSKSLVRNQHTPRNKMFLNYFEELINLKRILCVEIHIFVDFVHLFVSYAHVDLCHFFSSSWCQGLAAASACGSSLTFLFTSFFSIHFNALALRGGGGGDLCHFLSSSWCRGLAAASACGSSLTFMFTFFLNILMHLPCGGTGCSHNI